jgi:phytoene dehydrogenase-like protein
VLLEHGGKIETGVRVRAASELPDADVTIFDLAPGAVADILGDRLPPRVARAYRRFRHGPGAFKVDFAVEGGVPWTAEPARRAGTVHLGGTFAEVAATEREVDAGRMPRRPFVLVGQQYLADPQRSAGNVHPLWTYAYVPHGYTGDATEAITAQIERFAPGFRDRIVGMRACSTAGFAGSNANFVGGDIMTGAKTVRQLVLGPPPGPGPLRRRPARHLHLLGRHPARARRARHVRGRRRRLGTAPPAPLRAGALRPARRPVPPPAAASTARHRGGGGGRAHSAEPV